MANLTIKPASQLQIRHEGSWTACNEIRRGIMAERTFKIIQRFWNRVPSMATCTGCNYKFFAPSPLQHDPERAEIYLEEKYGLHRCRLEPTRARTYRHGM